MPSLVLVFLVAWAPPVASQIPEDDVMEVVHRLFDGMRAGDSAMVRSVFHPEARLLRAGLQDGEPNLQASAVDGFVSAVGAPHDESWDEPIWDWQVSVDGNLAAVWTKYAFYLGPRFSHCGVDAFLLFRGQDGWKIFSLADTARREGCEMPPGR